MRPLGKRIAWAGVALTLTAAMAAGVGTTFAYFTTHAEAVGGHTINLGDYTEITETFTDRTKHVVIRNQATDAGQSIPVFIRVKAFSGSSNPLTYSEPDGLSNWTPAADGYHYYTLPVAPGEETTQLDVKVTFPRTPPPAIPSTLSSFTKAPRCSTTPTASPTRTGATFLTTAI